MKVQTCLLLKNISLKIETLRACNYKLIISEEKFSHSTSCLLLKHISLKLETLRACNYKLVNY